MHQALCCYEFFLLSHALQIRNPSLHIRSQPAQFIHVCIEKFGGILCSFYFEEKTLSLFHCLGTVFQPIAILNQLQEADTLVITWHERVIKLWFIQKHIGLVRYTAIVTLREQHLQFIEFFHLGFCSLS